MGNQAEAGMGSDRPECIRPQFIFSRSYFDSSHKGMPRDCVQHTGVGKPQKNTGAI